jgi:hypothetical protein
MVLFLNFDGVLHPNAVQWTGKDGPTLRASGHRLFEGNRALARIAADFSDFQLILNTWWTYWIGFDACLRNLPKELSSRVVGSILPPSGSCAMLPHRINLATEAVDRTEEPALILDHADARYPKRLRQCSFLLEPMLGLSDAQAAHAFRRFIVGAIETKNESGGPQPFASER